MKKFFIFFFAATAFLLATPQISAEEPAFSFTCLPYLQNVTGTEATVLWATSADAVSWIEIAPDDNSHFYATERPKFFSTTLGKKNITTSHRITITGLQPNTTYRYRICSRQVTNNGESTIHYGRTIASDVYGRAPLRFRTASPQQKAQHFIVMNDIHENAQRYENLYNTINHSSLDFIVLNGDMVNNMNTLEQAYNGYLNTSSKLFATSLPFYMVRGNHETRGTQSQKYMELYSTPTGKPYYVERRGDLCFVVLDGGEDKPDTDIEYHDLAAFDQYRTEEAEWLKNVLSSDEYRTAPIRIVFIHVPPATKDAWHGEIEVNEKIIPLLNNAGVDLMLCGHLHAYQYREKGEYGVNFPIIVNSNNTLLDITTANGKINVKMINEQGEQLKQFQFNTTH